MTDQNLPCRYLGRLLARQSGRGELELAFPCLAGGRQGLVGIVEREGKIRTGDPVTIIQPRRTFPERSHDAR